MNELITQQVQLPDNLEDLSKFVLYNEERIQALRANIRAIKKVQLAKEVYEQKLAEAQEVGQITVEAAQKVGELLLQIQTAQGRRTDLTSSDARTKSEQLDEIGITRQRSNEYEQMALHPEQVQAAIQKAIERGDVVSRSQVMKEIKALKDENSRLKADNVTLSNRARPEVIEKEVIKEVVPDDYEEAKKSAEKWEQYYKESVSDYRKIADENLELKKRIRELQEPTTEQKIVSNAKEEMEYFIVATYEYIRKYGGKVWAFDKYKDAPVDTQKNFQKAIQQLSAFSQQLVNNLGGIEATTNEQLRADNKILAQSKSKEHYLKRVTGNNEALIKAMKDVKDPNKDRSVTFETFYAELEIMVDLFLDGWNSALERNASLITDDNKGNISDLLEKLSSLGMSDFA